MADKMVMVSTLYGRDNRIPMVQIEFADPVLQMSADNAVELAQNIMQAAQASMTDAFLIEFFKQSDFGLNDGHVFALLRDFRQWREARIARPPEGSKP